MSCLVLQIQVNIIFKELNLILFCQINMKRRSQDLHKTFFQVSKTFKIYLVLKINNYQIKKSNTQLQKLMANIFKKQKKIIGQSNLKMNKKKVKYLK